jgi:RHS repeat-associated protein
MRSVNSTAGKTTYWYNALGQRVRKTGQDTTYYFYDGEGRVLGEYDRNGSAIQETVYVNNMPVVVLKQEQGNTVPYYIYADHINTPRVITRANDNAMVWRWDNADPFGAAAPDVSLAGPVAFGYNPRFPGQMFDGESGFHYNYFRDYDPKTGRYITSDPIGLNGGINTYGYVSGNSLSFIDPLGLAKQKPNSAYCKNLSDKIQKGRTEVSTRLQELLDDQAALPERLASPKNEPFYATRRGHRTLINIRDSQTRRLEEKYDKDCGDDDNDESKSSCEVCPSGSTVVAVVGAGAATYGLYRCARMLPSLLPPLWWTIPANIIIP